MIEWIVFLPLIGFLLNSALTIGLFYKKRKSNTDKHAHANSVIPGVLATLFVLIPFVISVLGFMQLLELDPENRVIERHLFDWIHVGSLQINFALRFDSLSSLFCLVITGVGSLIHLYSIGYMGHDETPSKYFAYLNLFCFSMLVLVLGSSIPVLFLGWEGVGLCSYLLIGYWYSDQEKAVAGMKAFVVNRIGDLAFLIAAFLIFYQFNTLEFIGIKSALSAVPASEASITLIAILLFVACTGKSAQIPLYVWLPDAMAGPTPVSALIHAATMVTSGIYLVSRLGFLFSSAPDALVLIAWVGGITAFFAASIAIVQSDIKKILAYSTVSQLGYMFLGCGVGAYSAGVFHVITHAFFKALMFLAAGSVIHGMHHEQNIEKMGGLRKFMPKTYLVFMAGWVAICGIPPFSGFFSKDEILWKAFSSEHGSKGLWFLGWITAILTAFYMTRLIVLTFYGEFRSKEKPHESPSVMLVPLYILGILSLVGGAIGLPHASWLEGWLEPVVQDVSGHGHGQSGMEWFLMLLSVLGAALGVFIAFKIFGNSKKHAIIQEKFPRIHRLLLNKWYVDELYAFFFVKPLVSVSEFFWKIVDVSIIDRVVMDVGRSTRWVGETMRILQTGSVQTYGVILVMGLAALLGYMVYGLV